ncbi:carboxypeptidase regulatory-like domain-containing protein [Paenibacillus cellulosilyticus]|nr:carboxypeptidase regulatory-like domain-containing protein [Paenibacillus cellulosilyticus]
MPLRQGNIIVTDPVRDVSPDETDIVGDAQFPAAYYAYDGTNVYFRIRLNADPRQKSSFKNFAWGVLFDTDNNPSTYEWELVVNGLDNEVQLIVNTVKIPNVLTDQAEGTDGKGKPSYAESICNFDISRAQAVEDGSTLGGSTNFFIDFFVPAATLFQLLGITDSSSIRFLFFTATNNNNFNKDFIGTGQTLSTLFCDPVTIAGGDVRASLAVTQTVTTPAPVVIAGESTTFTGTITVTNTGRSAASTIFIQASYLFDKLITFNVTAKSLGTTAFNAITRALTWNVGNLAVGASATLTYQAVGLFATSGTRTVDTKAATGIDSFTGAAIAAPITSATVNAAALGGIAGTILDKSTGLPLVGATVTAVNTATSATAGQTTTGAGGVYSFASLAPGSYSLSYSLPTYLTAAASAAVTAGTVQTVNVTLVPTPAALQGSVTASGTGTPIPNPTITVTNAIGVRVLQASGDINGSYLINNLTPGYYRVSIAADGFQAKDFPVTLGIGETRTLDAALTPNPGTVTGIITNAQTGAPLAGALVEALDNRNSILSTALTAADGSYTLSSLAPATNDRLRVSTDTFVTQVIGFSIASGQTRTINAALSPVAGALTGIITDSATGATIAGASIRVFTSEGITLQTGSTGADGSYTIPSLMPGSYSVVIMEEGYAGRTIGAMIHAGAVTALNVALQQLAGAISGTVTDTSGNPIADAIVRIFSNNIIVVRVATREDGTYDIGNLAPGSYYVTVRAEGFGGLSFSAVVNPGETTIENFVLTPNPGSVNGTVTDTSGNPIAGAILTISLNVSGGGLLTTRYVSQTDGSYLIENLFPAPYLITAAANTFQSTFQSVTVASNQRAVANFSLQSDPGTLSGTVVDNNGIPVAGAAVLIKTSTGNGVTIATIFSDPNGHFQTSSLAPGNYTLLASAPDFQTASATLSVRSDEATPITLVLIPDPGSIQGSVVDARTGQPIFGVLVSVTDINNFQVASIIADDVSTFQFDSLPPGSYTVSVRALNYQSGTLGAIVMSNATTPIHFSLQPEPGIILGKVAPVVGGALVQLFNSNNILISTAITDPQGSFGFLGEAVGAYYLTAIADGFTSQAAGAAVTSNETTQVTIHLTPNPGSLAGTVVDTSGKPITTAVVKVLNSNESIRGSSPAQGDGSYVVEGIPIGTKTVIASAPNFGNQVKGITINPGQNVTQFNFVLMPDPGTVSGQITDSVSGLVLPGANIEIRADEASGLAVSTVASTPFGNYQITGLAPGAYTVIAKANNYATNTVGALATSNGFTIANLSLSPLFGTINGTVTDAFGNPIGSNDTKIKLYTQEGSLIETAFVSSNGTFSIMGVAPGEYVLTASAPAFETQTIGLSVLAGGVSNAQLILKPQTSAITGTIRNGSTFTPISGALVNITDIDGLPVETAFTDNSGSFTVSGVPAGNFVVSAIAPGFSSATSAVVTRSGQTASTDLTLSPLPGIVVGFVSDATNGANIAGAEIRIIDASTGAVVGTIQSGNGGQYAFPSLAPGNYQAVANANGYAAQFGGFTIAAGETTRFSFALQPLPGRLRGSVTRAGTSTPITGATVQLLQFNNFGPPLASILTDNNGLFDLGEVAAANYAITVTLDGFITEQTSALVNRGETTAIAIALRQSNTGVAGTVTFGAPSGPTPPSGPIGPPLPNSSITVIDHNGVVGGNGITDKSGQYIIPSIPTGEHTIVASNPAAGTGTTFLPDRPGQTQTADLQLGSAATPITGTANNTTDSSPIPGAIVQVLDHGNNNTLLLTSVTDKDGIYRTNPLPPGDYTVTISSPQHGSNAVSFVIPADPSPTLTPPLTPPTALLSSEFGTLRGTIRDASGQPLNLALAAIVTEQQRLIRQIISNNTGQYALSNLAAGVANAEFSFPGKQTAVRMPTIFNGQTTILDIILLDEDEE